MEYVEAGETHPRVEKLFELTKKYYVDTDCFRKPLSTLVDEAEHGDVEFRELLYEGVMWPIATRKCVVVDMTHITSDGTHYRFGEKRRIFPNGDSEIRFPEGEELLRETIRSEDGEDPFRAAIRCLAEEAEIYDPVLDMLLPRDPHSAPYTLPLAASLGGKVSYQLKKSVAYPGFLSGYYFWQYSYLASEKHFNDGRPVDTEDNHGVVTKGAWTRID